MKSWRWSLVSLVLLASRAPSQEAVPGPAAPGGLVFTPPEPCADHQPLCAGEGSTEAQGGALSGNHNFVHFINWVSNPLQNIDPRAVTAIYPLFGSSWISNSAPIPDGDAQVYGPAITIALSDRFALGLNQGGYAEASFSRDPVRHARLVALDPLGRFRDAESGGDRGGWLNLGGFFQYTLLENVEDQFLLSGGVRWEAPCGSHEIFQGHGPLELAPYLTGGKEFGKYHALATVGYQFPAGPGSDNTQIFYANVHLDRQIGCFYPLIEVNSLYHVNSVAFGLPAGRGFVNFDNFESTGNIVSLAAGANVVLVPERLEVGAVYTTVIASQHGFEADGLLVKMVLRY